MATAKKAPIKAVVKRRKPAEQAAAPAAKKRVVRRRKPVAEEPKIAAPTPEAVLNASLSEGPASEPETSQDTKEAPGALETADVIDLRKVNMLSRFAIVLELQLNGYIFDGCSQSDATDMVDNFANTLVSGLKLQHRNKLIFPLYSMTELPLEATITTPTATAVSALVMMTEPRVAAPKQMYRDGAVYVKASN